MNTLPALGCSILLLFAGFTVGRLTRKWWLTPDDSRVEELFIGLVFGLGFLSLIILGLGLIGFDFVVTPLRLCVVLGIAGIVLLLRSLDWRRKTKVKLDVAGIALWGLISVIAFVTIIPALAPPTMSDWDSLAYHLAVPRLYIEHGRIHYINFTSHSNFPFLMEMLYIPALEMGSLAGAKMMHYWMGVLLISAVIIAAKRHFGSGTGLLAALGVAGIPLVMWEATTAYVDLATALYVVIAVYFMLNYLDKPCAKYMIGCGIAAGLCASTKMTGAALVPIIIAWFAGDWLINKYALKKSEAVAGFRVIHLIAFAAVAGVVCAPWYIRSYVYTGNPVYPFFYSIFGGRDWTAALAANYSSLQAKFGMGHDIPAFLKLPWNLTVHSERFYDTPGLYVGPIFLVSIPVLFLLLRYGSRKTAGLCGCFLMLLAVWFNLSQQSRYLIPAFAVLSILVSALAYGNEKLRMVRGAVWTVFAATALFGIFTVYPFALNAAAYVFGNETTEEYLARNLDVYPAQDWMNQELPENAKVALFGDTRGLYLQREYVWADPGHNTIFTREYASAQDFISYLKSRHVTHVMVNYLFFPKRGDGKLALYRAIDEGLLAQVYPIDGSGHVGVYEIK